jgi:CDP-diacylglycerol---serine O-phosphatidyltransferase
VIDRGVIPSLFTLGNLVCGFVALSFVAEGRYVSAAWLVVLAAALDNMDGRIARFIGKDSKFGIEFDSLADVCTFGVVPAFMLYHSLLHSPWGAMVASLFLLAGASRLARFNVISHEQGGKGEFFMGLPIPAAAIVMTQYIVYTERTWDTMHAAQFGIAVMGLLILLMVSRLEYDAVPNFRSSALRDRIKVLYFLGCIVLILHPATTPEFFFPLGMLYIASGFYRWISSMLSDEVTQHA